MTPKQLDLCIATFGYGGNGNIPSTVPHVGLWLEKVLPEMKADGRLGNIRRQEYCDTPITMLRNRAVVNAREVGADLLLMIDSDQYPDYELEEYADPDAKPFWKTSFDFVYDRYEKGPVCVAAPYCGSPPHENVFGFCWVNEQSQNPQEVDLRLTQYTRHEASRMAGIQEAAAAPTGLILFDMRCFELTEPRKQERFGQDEYLSIDGRPIKPASTSWFYYEWENLHQTEKGSTEDVTATRDISMAGCAILGYNPLFINWDAWAGHWKMKCVGKPRMLTVEQIGERYRNAIDRAPASRKQTVVQSDYADQVDWANAPRSPNGPQQCNYFHTEEQPCPSPR